jgi:sugar/nucleoside kinase (ribokinase family)
MDYVTFGIILDDLERADGVTRRGLLGGGGPQTAFGMRLWADSIGLAAGVGPDLPAEALEWFLRCGIDTAGLRRFELPTPRAWQVLEEDGRRTQVWRVPGKVLGVQLERRVEYLPPAYRSARGFHLGVHPLEPEEDLIRDLRGLGAVVSVEVFMPSARPLSAQELHRLAASGDIFSPNLHEARSFFEGGAALPPEALIERLLEAGARIVTLRMGHNGSLVASQTQPGPQHIPVFPVSVVDPVGAGNAYCGGFLVGWCESGDLLTAGRCAAVAASFLVEQVGIPLVTEPVLAEARKRLGSFGMSNG